LHTRAEPTATGVEYTINGGETQTAKARNEVILSAGAINTPKLLELSGVGSPAILNQFTIPVRVHNPHVGENLQDYLIAGVSFEVVDSYRSTTDDIARQVPEALDKAMRDY
jgi:choline dehydrogenase-like flavoprotein